MKSNFAKSFFKFIAVMTVAALSLSSCTTTSLQSKHSELRQLAPTATNGDEFLFEIRYADWDFDKQEKFFEERFDSFLPAHGCSSVRNGNFHGRNLDYYINELADVIVRMDASPERFASIGMASCFDAFKQSKFAAGELSPFDYEIIPAVMTDGINENGVVINVNVLNCNDFDDTGVCAPTVSTNPGAPRLSGSMVVRYILDKATSVDHAIELLQARDIYVPAQELHFEVHYMISDPTKTVIVEFWNNKMIVTEKNIMTNYYASHPETAYGIGHEREAVLLEHFDEGATMQGMCNLMDRVKYSRMYDLSQEPLFYTEFIGTRDEECGLGPFTWQQVKAGDTEDLLKLMKFSVKDYISVDHQKQIRPTKSWYTTHRTVYDIENRSFTLCEQENDKVYTFKLMD